MSYTAASTRYQNMKYNRCGNSGLFLPALSLGLWQNFSESDDYENIKQTLRLAFDSGVTHFDLANNYGPPPGSAERVFGKILKEDFSNYRDEMIISTKAGHKMWDGPYGDYGSKKYLTASLDQSLKRMGLEYVDIFYHHRPDPGTPMEETMAALDLIVRQGKALYVGISAYNPADTQKAILILKQLGTPCLIHQPRYSMFERRIENGLLDVLGKEGVGCIAFSTLAQGLLTDKYLKGVPADSRVAMQRGNGAMAKDQVTPDKIKKVTELNEMAIQRGQTLAQMALSWALRDPRMTSLILGVSKPAQLTDSLKCLEAPAFAADELQLIDSILAGN